LERFLLQAVLVGSATGFRAGRWERGVVQDWLTWVADTQSPRREALQTFASAVKAVVRTYVRSVNDARSVVRELIPTLRHCDELAFDRPEQAVAYAIWHLTDRYSRVVEALDQLFRTGDLPLRTTRMSVLDVGAGPAPAIYAVNDYYLALAAWCTGTNQPVQLLPPTRLDTLDRGPAWRGFLHMLSETLPRSSDTTSPLPFWVTYANLEGFSVQAEHRAGIEKAVWRVKAEADEWDHYALP
jgi:hypothetical protein